MLVTFAICVAGGGCRQRESSQGPRLGCTSSVTRRMTTASSRGPCIQMTTTVPLSMQQWEQTDAYCLAVWQCRRRLHAEGKLPEGEAGERFLSDYDKVEDYGKQRGPRRRKTTPQEDRLMLRAWFRQEPCLLWPCRSCCTNGTCSEHSPVRCCTWAQGCTQGHHALSRLHFGILAKLMKVTHGNALGGSEATMELGSWHMHKIQIPKSLRVFAAPVGVLPSPASALSHRKLTYRMAHAGFCRKGESAPRWLFAACSARLSALSFCLESLMEQSQFCFWRKVLQSLKHSCASFFAGLSVARERCATRKAEGC